jgi:Ca2+-binding EF-hand superfamily protein
MMQPSPPVTPLIGGWPAPSTRPSGGGGELGSCGPNLRGSAWQRRLRKPTEDPPSERASPMERAIRRTTSSFFRPAGVALGASPRLPRPPLTAPRLPQAPSTGSISYRPSEFMGATAPRRRPPRLGSGYPSPGGSLSARPAAPSSVPYRRPTRLTRQQQSQVQHKLWEDMRRVRHTRQRETELAAYKFAFNLIDADQSNTVDAGEVLMLLKTMGRSATVEGGFWAAFNELDGDRSNGLDFDEFSEVLDRVRGRNTAEQLQALQAGDRSPDGDADFDTQATLGMEFASRQDPNRAGGGQIGAAMPAPMQRFPSVYTPSGADLGFVSDTPEPAMVATPQDGSALPRTPSSFEPIGEDLRRETVSREREVSRPSTVDKANGTVFMSEAIELQRQLLDVYCAIDKIRETSLKTMVVSPYDDSRVRTEMGRASLNDTMQAELTASRRTPDALCVQTDSFEDLGDLSVSATGGVSNQKDQMIEQQRREMRKAPGGGAAHRKAQLAVRSTIAKNAQDALRGQYLHLPPDAQHILDQFLQLFEAPTLGFVPPIEW